MGHGDANIRPAGGEKPDETKRAEAGALSELQKDLHLSSKDATRVVHQFEQADMRQHQQAGDKIDEHTIAQDLTRITDKLAKLFKPGENGGPSLFDQIKASGHADGLDQTMTQTAKLATQLVASFESGKIKPGHDTRKAVEDLMQKLNTRGT